MGKQAIYSLILIFLLFFIPFLCGEPTEPAPQTEVPSQLSGADSEPAPPEETEIDKAITLNVLTGGEVSQMDMETYLTGVVRAEMPATFEQEALKAQSVAARTYTLHKILGGGSPNHPEADACDDITCCQAYKTYEEAAASWGTDAAAYEEKVRRAVSETDGECILYEGEPILSVFHSSSAGVTQDASAVWSGSLPYLQSVETPEGSDTVPNYHTTASFTSTELKTLLQNALPDAKLSGSPSTWFTNIRQQPSGTVTSLSIGGVSVTGGQLRSILNLRSACFTISFEGDKVTFSVTGYGHGVGMSQYGANVLAAGGMGYRDILSWYYTGTEVQQYKERNRMQ